jgi:glutathione synthase/RimK-type ligase-like ATP-grasp enzyme
VQHRLLIVDQPEDWQPYLPSDDVITAASYLEGGSEYSHPRTRVINLCGDLHYASTGYHCSLLAEARGQQVIPPVRAMGDLDNQAFYQLFDERGQRALKRWAQTRTERTEVLRARAYFGHCEQPELADVARRLFEQYRFPILEFSLLPGPQPVLGELRSVALAELNDAEQDAFANALDAYDKHIWREPRSRRSARYDVAMLIDPEEKLPPSNRAALQRFKRAGRELGMQVELITEADYARLLEYDALFIRTTTAVNHYTYRFARRARSEGLVVIDSPEAILRACNKVYLAELLARHNIPAPQTRALVKGMPVDADELGAALGWPMVVKVPDGSFSRGVVKARDAEELHSQCAKLFETSAVLLAQAFVPTSFDWRIGVLDGRALYACRYHMVSGHWQIYQHSGAESATATGARVKSGGFDSLPLAEVPRSVLRVAERAAKLLGPGIFGVDMKEVDGQPLVIEINDNPSIETGVEDAVLGQMLYRSVMLSLLERLEQRHESNRSGAN